MYNINMQFVVIAHDYKDAMERRLAVRRKHFKLGDKMETEGKQLYGVALLNNEGHMCGSLIILDVKSRQELDDYLKIEPYVTGRVWEKIEVLPCHRNFPFTTEPEV